MTDTSTPRHDTVAGVWAYAPDVAYTCESERYVLVDLSSPATPPRVLSGPAALIWECVNGERNLDEVVAAVYAAVAPDSDEDDTDQTTTGEGESEQPETVDIEVVAHDVEAFLASLESDGLVVRRPRSQGGSDV